MANKDPFDDELMAELGLESGKPPVPSAPVPRAPAPGVPVAKSPAAPAAPQQSRPPASAAPMPPKVSDPATGKTQISAPPKAPSSSPPVPSHSAESEQVALDMPVQVVAVLGKRTLTLKEILSLKQGELFELKKLPQEQIDLVANGKLIARGDLVLIDGKMGLQIKQIVK